MVGVVVVLAFILRTKIVLVVLPPLRADTVKPAVRRVVSMGAIKTMFFTALAAAVTFRTVGAYTVVPMLVVFVLAVPVVAFTALIWNIKAVAAIVPSWIRMGLIMSIVAGRVGWLWLPGCVYRKAAASTE